MLRRRDLLRGGAGALALTALGREARAASPDAAPPPSPTPAPAASKPVAPAPVAVDVHCHTFCSADLPIVGFVAHFIPGLTELSRFVSRWPEVAVRAFVGAVAKLPDAAAPTAEVELGRLRDLAAHAGPPVAPVPPLPAELLDMLLEKLAKRLPFTVGPEKRRIIERYLTTLYLVAHPRSAIAASLTDLFPSVSLFTPALVDYDAWSEDRAPTPLWQQILVQEQIARLSTLGRIGRADARFHPFVAFDPRRQVEGLARAGKPASAPTAAPATPGAGSSALDLVRYAIEAAGFLGVKIYPPVGFAPGDNVHLRADLPFAAGLDGALEALYAYCAGAEAPILTHTSSANEYGLGLHRLASPLHWAPVLERHPTLRLNFGHFGHDYGVADPAAPKPTPDAWISQAAALIEGHPNVYADLSNSPLVYDAAYRQRLVPLLGDVIARYPKVKRRLMYGSDWWLSGLDPDADAAVEQFRATLGGLLGPEGLADLMGRNALRFLGFLDDDGRPRNGAAAARLRKFYSGVTFPSWLPTG
ncbi:MAG TPA: amidohydrolase family protein [Polyangia bacterium]|nr:amidohydrolase family protein [Polyangia bacterium]